MADQDNVQTQVFEMLKKTLPDEYEKLHKDEENLLYIKAEIKETIKTLQQAEKALKGVELEPNAIISALSKVYTTDQLKNIQEAFLTKSWKIEVFEKYGKTWVSVKRGTSHLTPVRPLSEDSRNTAIDSQAGSIVYESVVFLVRIVGGAVSYRKDMPEKVSQEIEKHPQAKNAISEFVSDWKKAKGSVSEEAKAIFKLLKKLWDFDVLMDTIELIISDMPWYDKALFFIQLAVYIALLIQPEVDALVLISKLIAALKDEEAAAQLQEKINKYSFLTTVKFQ